MSDLTVLFGETQIVKIGAVKAYDRNPRKGDVEEITKSLVANGGQYKPLLVQKSTNKIISGNHTWRAMKGLGWTKVAISYLDVTDEVAKRIVVGDNRLSELGGIDQQILAALLSEMDSPEGTGYSDNDMQAIISAAQNSMDEVSESSEGMSERSLIDLDGFASGPLQDRGESNLGEAGFAGDEEDDDPSIVDASAELPGVIQLDDMRFFDGVGPWEIPPLRPDMLITELPEDLKTWAGSATRDDPHTGYWLYNWAVDSTSGMSDLSKIVVSFYTHDEYFAPWWDFAARYCTKLLNSKVKYGIQPNFSTGGMPKAMSIFQQYKSFWVARFMQEAGIKIMPDMECREEPEFMRAWRACVPNHLSWVAVQMQNLFTTSRGGKAAEEQDWLDLMALMTEQTKGMQIDNVLVYAPTKRWEWITEHWPFGAAKPYFLPTRVELLAERSKTKKAENKASGRGF